MARKPDTPAAKDKEGRVRVNLSLTPEQAADLDAMRGDVPLTVFIKKAILRTILHDTGGLWFRKGTIVRVMDRSGRTVEGRAWFGGIVSIYHEGDDIDLLMDLSTPFPPPETKK